MMNIILAIHIMACVFLIVLVLIQKSEGGGLGLGGGGGANSMFSARGTAGAVVRATMLVGGIFVVTSLVLTGLANHRNDTRTEVQKEMGVAAPEKDNPDDLYDPTKALGISPTSTTPVAPVTDTVPATPAPGDTTTVTPAPQPAPAEPQPATPPQ